MRDTGLLDQDEEGDRYRLGMKLFELGNTMLANMELHRETRPFAEPQHGRAARRFTSPEKTPSPATIEQAPVHCTSIGKAILVFQPDEILQRIIKDHPLSGYDQFKFAPWQVSPPDLVFLGEQKPS